jgi:hypothetical protein
MDSADRKLIDRRAGPKFSGPPNWASRLRPLRLHPAQLARLTGFGGSRWGRHGSRCRDDSSAPYEPGWVAIPTMPIKWAIRAIK